MYNHSGHDLNSIHNHGNGNNNLIHSLLNVYIGTNSPLRARLAILFSVLFGIFMAYATKQALSEYSFLPIFFGLFSYAFGRLFFLAAICYMGFRFIFKTAILNLFPIH